MTRTRLRVVGIGCDGLDGLTARARAVLADARRIIGAPRQLELLDVGESASASPGCPDNPDATASYATAPPITAERATWPEGYWRRWGEVLADLDPSGDVILASGDPMFHGIGTTLVRELGADAIEVFPAPSSASLACARLGWALDRTPVVSLVTGPAGREGAGAVVPLADAGQPFLVLCRGADSVAHVADALSDRPDSVLTTLTNAGGGEAGPYPESIARGTAAHPPTPAGDLTILAVEPSGPSRAWLPDDAFDTDGQLTKSPIRELTVAALGPRPGALLWDVGGGTGSIAIEWARHGGRAICIERDATRAERIRANAANLSGGVEVVHGSAPEALAPLADVHRAAPDAIFIGGGLTAEGMIDACVDALAPGGRLVANTVTIESEAVLWDARSRFGGEVHRIGVERAGRVGSFTAWRPALPVVQWVVDGPSQSNAAGGAPAGPADAEGTARRGAEGEQNQ
ncbi:precorrin-6Y C5,15-methyltransferase (decarboxylating) subunit CbiT [Corynebacterium hansenii]|uniref:Precorrin-6Y C5,15-methyltransferase (Decarboxylating) subunit CbiT n=1 Tax=Corynebacterium hansenii TaxID=394964 RepID=A0ABV7ZQS1_9CORY|nr:precorrin-6Y C5,15-methyltransferase (decarboxylating) subunit CbiT [Corynebacterium hansenii]WJZ00052.1 Precorrin-6Y C(5,15)-methyltransferase [decarboxylating] [Corynebacterium hansenii]